MKAANPNASEAELIKMTRKWVALPIALGGRGSAHNRGTAVDINSKGAAAIDAINGMTYNGQKVTTNSFLAMFGLARPLSHEPWHVQPLEGAPTPDNPDPNGKPLVADAKGNMVNLETGKSESIPPPAPITAQTQKESLPSVSDSAAATPAAMGPPASATASSYNVTPAPSAPSAPTAPAAPAAAPLAAQAAPNNNLSPMPNTTGNQVAQGSAQLASSQMTAQATPAPAPVVVNNNNAGPQKPIEAPKQPVSKASSRSSENSFVRAISKDFSHPTSFTSSIIV